MQPIRILHAPTNIANQAWGISAQERLLGHTSEVVVYVQKNPSYSADHNLHFERRHALSKLLAASHAFLRAVLRFDIIHFYFATTFFPTSFDVPLLRALGKKLFFTFQGCDVRTDCFAEALDPAHHRHIEKTRQQRNTRFLMRYATKAYVLNPDLLDNVPEATFVPYGSVHPDAWPYLPRAYRPGEEVVIFHAPSDRVLKGTPSLEKAVARLHDEGYKVRLDLAHDVSWAVVRNKIQHAHLAVDQLMGGWYGAAAVEMMASGKPTVCYLRQDWLARTDSDFQQAMPIVNSSHEHVYESLKRLLDHPETWGSLSQRGRRFIETFHHPRTIAERYVQDYAEARSVSGQKE